ncbi:MAG TPA: sulfite exporter TauE/SafE family protein [Fimbriimonadaceae bacterium]|nr:sulfite exporter TauE/SafE family protein [Fimbriimonadaceae bacterium]
MAYLLCLLAGTIAGVSSGLFGIGGGVIIVPFLILAIHYEQHKAQGTALMGMMPPVTILAAYTYYMDGKANLPLGLLIAVGITLGGIAGSKIALGFSPTTMRKIFSTFLILVAIYLFFKVALLQGAPDKVSALPGWAWPACFGIGLFAGTSGGLLGIGGGIIIVPFLVVAMGFPQHLAQGTSLVALTLPVSGLSAYNYYKKGNADLKSGACLAVGLLVGALFGSMFALGLDPQTMQRTFSGFVIVVASYLFFKRDPAKAATAAR